MTSSDPRSVLGTLRARIATLERGSGTAPAPVAYLPFGLSAIDRLLPGRGLQLGALHEVAPAQAAI
ncbi:damage-inducible mutagenesis protein, partial [Methylobacterium hispanicum]